jgi:hypothetical protein
MTEFRIRCGDALHRVVWTGEQYLAPDHDETAQVLDAIAGQSAKCEHVARAANDALLSGDFRCTNDKLGKHVREQAIASAERYLESAELPFDCRSAVALRWVVAGSIPRSHDHNAEPMADRRWLQGCTATRKVMGLAKYASTCCAQERTVHGSNLSHGYRMHFAHDGATAAVALSDAYDRVVLWRTCLSGKSSYNHALSATLSGWGALAMDNRSASGKEAALANFVALLLYAWKKRTMTVMTFDARGTVKHRPDGWLESWAVSSQIHLPNPPHPSVLRGVQ